MGVRNPNWRNRTILVAEDSEDEYLLLSRYFRSAKGEPETELKRASDGEQTIEYLEGKGDFADRLAFPLPAMLLLDVKMPRKNGFEVLRWVRAHDQLHNLIIVMLSTSDHPDDINKAYSLGANSYLAKHSLERYPNAIQTLKEYWLKINEPASAPGLGGV